MGPNDADPAAHLEAAIAELQEAQKVGPCRERALAITKAEEALMWLEHVPTPAK